MGNLGFWLASDYSMGLNQPGWSDWIHSIVVGFFFVLVFPSLASFKGCCDHELILSCWLAITMLVAVSLVLVLTAFLWQYGQLLMSGICYRWLAAMWILYLMIGFPQHCCCVHEFWQLFEGHKRCQSTFCSHGICWQNGFYFPLELAENLYN